MKIDVHNLAARLYEAYRNQLVHEYVIGRLDDKDFDVFPNNFGAVDAVTRERFVAMASAAYIAIANQLVEIANTD